MRFSKKFKATSGDLPPLRVTWEDDWENVEIFYQGISIFQCEDLKTLNGISSSTIPELGELRVSYDSEGKDISIDVGTNSFKMDSIQTWNNFHGLSILFFALGGFHLFYATFLLMRFEFYDEWSIVLTVALFINTFVYLLTAIQLRKEQYMMYFIAVGVLILSIPLAFTEIYYFDIPGRRATTLFIVIRPLILVALIRRGKQVLDAMKTTQVEENDEILDI